MSKSVQKHQFKEAFVTESGVTLPEPEVAYQTWGRLNKARNNVILICHALTGNTAADEWFSGLFGANLPFDQDQKFIICTNSLGSCYGTSGPISHNPETGEPYRIDFPRVSIRDMVRLQQRLFDELQITGIELVIGGSMGGMQALEWCIMDDRPQSAVLVGMGKTHSPWAVGINHTQRQAIYNDPNWQNGYYTDDKVPEDGLALARMIAMISYRSDADYEQKFGRLLQQDGDRFQVESYLSYQGKKLVNRFDAISYVRLTQALDSHDVARGRSSYEEVLGAVEIPILVIGIDSDILYPIGEQHELAQLLADGRYRELRSPHGHDAFLIEFEKMNNIIAPFLIETPTPTLSS